MRIAICDDDILICDQLTSYIQEYFQRNHLKCPTIHLFADGESVLKDPSQKDIVFLDIELPGLSGITVGNALKKTNSKTIIFVITSYAEYLDDAMRFHVFRYLSKPLEKQRLFRNLKDALHVYSITNAKVAIETKCGVVTVLYSDIIYIEAANRKVTVHTTHGNYESIHTMQEWRKCLPDSCFFQSHRSFIVNMKHVTNFDHTLIYLYYNQYQAYLTRRKYTNFKQAYLLYLESTR